MDDTQIIELFWNRDELALKEVGKKYTNFCFSIAWKILQNNEDSEECVNDTWLAAWKYIPPKKPSVLSCFLGKITRGFAIDNLRKKYAMKRVDLHMSNTIIDETKDLNRQLSYSLDEQLSEKELLQLINTFLKTLKETDRDIFIRRYWHLDSIADISKRHGKSKASIKSNLFRTRKKLKQILQEEGYTI